MEWIDINDKLPLAYTAGGNQVIAKDAFGKLYLATYEEVRFDGNEFQDWYDDIGLLIEKKIVQWMKIPE